MSKPLSPLAGGEIVTGYLLNSKLLFNMEVQFCLQ